MYRSKTVTLIIPARNEALALPDVLRTVPAEVSRVLVVDNGSTDDTARVARQHGARVVSEPRAGYGRACLAGLAAQRSDPSDIVAFADGDGSDDLSRLFELLDPLVDGEAELTLAMRIPVDPAAMSVQQRFGNWLATRLIRLFWGHEYRDLGPMRAITWIALQELGMRDPNYGWTVEMQIRALKKGLRARELPIPYGKRKAGRSKVSRSLTGSIRAGAKILWIIGREIPGPGTRRPATNGGGRNAEGYSRENQARR
ncbi:MAG: glycosyltransferase family 2 protein [Syntrophobacteraceae bacterium]